MDEGKKGISGSKGLYSFLCFKKGALYLSFCDSENIRKNNEETMEDWASLKTDFLGTRDSTDTAMNFDSSS
jgi:hypothetical protein